MTRLCARRGAALIATTVAMTAAMLLIAATIDVSRLMAVKTELQTAADAAALAVADQMIDAPPSAHRRAATVASSNTVTGTSAIEVDSVRLGTWDNSSGAFTALADPWTSDAAHVVVSTPVQYRFARLLGIDGARLKVRATAWLAPVEDAWCAKPWFLLTDDVLRLVDKPSGKWADLEPEDVRKMRDTSRSKRWTDLRDRQSGPLKVSAISLPAYEDGGTGAQGGDYLRQSIPKCHRLRVGWSVFPISGEKNGPTVQGAADLCEPLHNDICYNGSGGIGIPVAIPVFDLKPAEVDGRTSYKVAGIVGFMLTGVVEKGGDAGNVSGFLIGLQGSGRISSVPSGMTAAKLVR